MSNNPMKIGFLNVQGIHNHVEEIEDWILHADLNITAVIETKLTPEKSIPSHLTTISARQPPRFGNSGRLSPSGGINLFLSDIPRHKIVLQFADPDFEAVGITVKEITYVAVYMRSHISREDFEHYFKHIHMTCRGRTIIFGDLNARHRSWCSKTNQSGAWLHRWGRKNGWLIQAPNFTTRNHIPRNNHSSPQHTTIDLFVTRAATVTDIKPARKH